MTETNLALPKLQHVTITFPPGEERRLRDFYINVLGLKEKPVPEVATLEQERSNCIPCPMRQRYPKILPIIFASKLTI
jgi:hypothetical protein